MNPNKNASDRISILSPGCSVPTEGLVHDSLFDFEELRPAVIDLVQRLLHAYCPIDTLVYRERVASEQDPLKVEVPFGKKGFHFFMRCPIGSYVTCNLDAGIFKLASKVLRVYGRAYLLCFPSGEKFLSEDEVIRSLAHWVLLVCEGTWAKEFKHRLLSCFSRCEDQEIPNYATPHTFRVFQGTFGKHAYRDAFGRSRRSRIWRNTILHGVKKGAPVVGTDMLYTALQDHGKLLGDSTLYHNLHSRSSSPTEHLRLDDEHQQFLLLVQNLSRTVFGDVKLRPPTVGIKMSQRASYEHKAFEGGTLGGLLELENYQFPAQTELVTIVYHPKIGTREVRTNQFTFGDPVRNRRVPSGITDSCWGVIPLREPLKVRVITAGQEHLNSYWPDVQQSLWKSLQRYPCFGLTSGQKPWSYQLTCPVEKRPGWTIVSGDYKAATDSIFREVMEAAISGIQDRGMVDLLTTNLNRGVLNYEGSVNQISRENSRGGSLPPISAVQQKRGQLMGSIFSFPILCLINLATYLWACIQTNTWLPGLKTWKRTILSSTIKQVAALINGDDILFIAPDRTFYQEWVSGSSHAGFSLSIGKNYTSQRFALVNSTYMVYEPTTGHLSPVPYVNMGIVFGIKKSSELEGDRASMRQRMAILPTYFVDLFKHFKGGDLPLRQRISDYVYHCRKDVKISKWSRETLGLTTKGFNFEKALGDRVRLFGHLDRSEQKDPVGDVDQQSDFTSQLAGFSWKLKVPTPTDCLRRPSTTRGHVSRHSTTPCTYVSQLIRDYWVNRERGILEQWWQSNVRVRERL